MTGGGTGLRGEYSGIIAARGAAVRMLRHGEWDLVVPFPAGGPGPDLPRRRRRALAQPDPDGGMCTFHGVDYQLPVNEPRPGVRPARLPRLRHGMGSESRDEALERLCWAMGAVAGYPFGLQIAASYGLDGDGLHSRITAVNTGAEAAPYGVCPHPYLVAGPAPLDAWTLEMPADCFFEVTPDRLLPVATRPVAGHDFDFRAAPHRCRGDRPCFHRHGVRCQETGRSDRQGPRRNRSWHGMGSALPWLQVHTADKLPPAPDRLGLAVEPMTCPPDAFNSGQNLKRLEPGGSHEASWRIFAA